jgi:hypothetical protein
MKERNKKGFASFIVAIFVILIIITTFLLTHVIIDKIQDSIKNENGLIEEFFTVKVDEKMNNFDVETFDSFHKVAVYNFLELELDEKLKVRDLLIYYSKGNFLNKEKIKDLENVRVEFLKKLGFDVDIAEYGETRLFFSSILVNDFNSKKRNKLFLPKFYVRNIKNDLIYIYWIY